MQIYAFTYNGKHEFCDRQNGNRNDKKGDNKCI